MSEKVSIIREFHETKYFGNLGNLLRQQSRAVDLYRSLTVEEVGELAQFAIVSIETTGVDSTEGILSHLACFHPGCLVEFHEALVGLGVFYPATIYYGADAVTAARVVGLLPGKDTDKMLCALAWIGDEVVQDAFRRWRAEPPEWSDRLFVPPDRYAEEAGWELTPQGSRRDLFVHGCRPLVVPDEGTHAGVAKVVGDHEEACRWCDQRMTTLLDLDHSSPELAFLGPRGRRLRISTCPVCSCYGTVFTKIDPDGGSTWHPANRRPDYLPDKSEEWVRLPTDCLVLGSEPRNGLESANWLVGGIRFSQVGGYPTWVQDAEYPGCPECERAMPFVAQLSIEDVETYGEGIYYMFACTECGVAATSYQQS